MRVLIVEDRIADAELMLAELRSAGIPCTHARVEREAEYLRELGEGVDLILADYSLPAFSATRALDVLSERRLDVPLIVVTGTVGEDAAIECMKKGAADYLLKDRMARLGLAVRQAIAGRTLRQQQRDAETRLRIQAELLQAVDHGVLATDLRRKITYWNGAAEQLCGWSESEALGRDALEVTAAELAERDAAVIVHRYLREGVSWSGELILHRRDGSQFPAQVTCSSIHSGGGGVTGVICVFHDITERRHAEIALRESEERLRLITDHVRDLVCQTTLDGVFLYASPSHERVLGYPADTLIGRTAMEIVHPDDRERVMAVIRSATIAQSEGRLELRAKHAAGHYVWIEAVGAFLADDVGRPSGAVISARDITNRKRLEEDLQRRSDELERFNRLAVGREMRMIELKQRINELSQRLGEPPPYAGEPAQKRTEVR